MITLSRRHFLGASASAAVLASAFPMPAIAQAKPRVVVIGGGPGGATVARYIAKDSKDAVAVTLVEPASQFTTCFHSNLHVGGYKTMAEITHGYDKLTAMGITHARTMANAIDREKKIVTLADGNTLAYDRLVVAPGIDLKYDSVAGYSVEAAEIMPHAWKAGPQTELLVKQLNAVPDGGVVVMIAPPNPYRCPPGPYERISMFAHVLKAAGKTKCKIMVFDLKDKFSKQALFMEGWEKHYPGMIEWMDPSMHSGIKSVDAKSMRVETGLETVDAALVNVIPAQMAGKIARDAGLTNESGFCPIDAANMKSTKDANIFVLGDASIAGDMPKSAFSANSQAKVVANAVRGDLTGSRVFPAKYSNTCWSLIETDDTVKVGASYEPKDGKITTVTPFVSQTGETAELRKQTSDENIGWYKGIVADIFG